MCTALQRVITCLSEIKKKKRKLKYLFTFFLCSISLFVPANPQHIFTWTSKACIHMNFRKMYSQEHPQHVFTGTSTTCLHMNINNMSSQHVFTWTSTKQYPLFLLTCNVMYTHCSKKKNTAGNKPTENILGKIIETTAVTQTLNWASSVPCGSASGRQSVRGNNSKPLSDAGSTLRL